jgi:E3 ubiquitin-protein ligase RNF115/126
MLNGLIVGGGAQGQALAQGQGQGLFSGVPGTNRDLTAPQHSRDESAAGGPHVSGGRFTYHGGARLFPRDGNNAAHAEPVDEITK